MVKRHYFLIILCLLTFYLLFICFPGIRFHAINTGLDNSWTYGINYLVQSEYTFGKDVVFTFGPLGFILQPIDMGANLLYSITFWLLIYFILGALLFYILLRRKQRLTYFIFLLAFIIAWALMSSSFSGYYYANQYLIMMLVGLILCTFGFNDSRLFYIPLFIAGMLSGLTVFMKLNLGIANIGMIFLYSVFLIVKIRRKALYPLIASWGGCLSSVIALLFIHFHSIENLYLWLRASFEIISGYSAAMGYGSTQIPLMILGFIGLVFYVMLLALALIQKNELSFTCLIFASPILFTFKESFVRQDFGHIIYFFLFLPFVISICILFTRNRFGLILTSCIFFISLSLAAVFPLAYQHGEALEYKLPQVVKTLSGIEGLNKYSALFSLDNIRNYYEEKGNTNLERDRLPDKWVSEIGNGSSDAVPWEISYMPANNLNWIPNPVLQTYSEYTSYLDNWSASHYSGINSPQYLIAEYKSIDNRHPLMDAPATWRSILFNYKLLYYDSDAERCLLENNTALTDTKLKVIGNRKASSGEWIDVPENNNLLYARINMPSSLIGKTIGILYLTPPVKIDLVYTNGQTHSYRIIINTAQNGIPINYVPSNSEEFNKLLNGDLDSRVEKFMITGPGINYYSNNIDITWMESSYIIKNLEK